MTGIERDVAIADRFRGRYDRVSHLSGSKAGFERCPASANAMNGDRNPIYWSFSIGTWYSTQVRISYFFPLILLVMMLQIQPWQVGAVFALLWFACVVAHEFGHVVAARQTGGFADEIMLWPLGGLAVVQPAPNVRSRLFTSGAGPLVNLVICLTVLWPVVVSGHLPTALNPLDFPQVTLSDRVVSDVFVLLFKASFLQLIINLIPVHPLDGGQMLLTTLSVWWDGRIVREVYVRVGFFVAFALMLGGLIADSAALVFFGAIVALLNVQETYQMQSSEPFDDSFLGYDFSEGYTSLERSSHASKRPSPKGKGLLGAWLERRKQRRLQRQMELDAEDDRRLDEILAKLHSSGQSSLTDSERRALERASNRYRNRVDPDA